MQHFELSLKGQTGSNFKLLFSSNFLSFYIIIKSYVDQIVWGPDYPNSVPEISLDTFYNRHLVTSVKELIVEELLTQANDLVGMSMTYSLFELAEEKGEMWLQRQPEVAVVNQVETQKQDQSQAKHQGQWRRKFYFSKHYIPT